MLAISASQARLPAWLRHKLEFISYPTLIKLCALIALVLSVVSVDSAYARTTTPVICTNSQADRALIQSAINNSASGDTIELIGTCQLDGTAVFINKSDLTIEGAGAAGNWSTVVSGLLGPSGRPLGDSGTPTFQWFNRGFSLGPSTTAISGVTIQGIKFANLNTAVNISPSIGGNSNGCTSIQITSGSASDILVTNNWFDNDNRAFSNVGLSDHINVVGNLVTNSGLSGVDIFSGGVLGCQNQLSQAWIITQFPSSVLIQNNIIQNDQASLFPIFVLDVQSIKIIRNTVTASGIVSIAFSAQIAHVSQNSVDGSGIALAGIFDNQAFPSTQLGTLDHQISNNSTRNNVLVGIGVDSGITESSVVNNQFDTSGVANILLCDANASTNNVAAALCDGGGTASYLNTVITTNFSNTVMDLGVGNQLIGTQNALNNPNVPSSTSTKLFQSAVGRPPLP